MQIELHLDYMPTSVGNRKFVVKETIEDEGYEENIVRLNNPMASGTFREIYFDNLRIGIGELSLAQETTLRFDNKDKMVEMYYTLEADARILSDGLEEEIRFKPHEHNIVYYDSLNGELICGKGDFQIVEIDMAPEFFQKYLSEEEHVNQRFLKIITAGSSDKLASANGHITLEMYNIISEIKDCSRKGLYKKMFMEAKIIELLLLQLEQLAESTERPISIKPKDVEKLYIVRDFILDNLTADHSLKELAKMAGTNEYTLKKGFKEVFDTTVFNFWADAKMKKAMEMLKNPDISIKEVAYEIGYKYPQHFTAAFKRKFGIVPSLARNQ